ncbi:uncharacterized protein JN550_003825 [Neoarthrinium moseri]|uniref:uncharacterized protein n=1 Tax=Neoarthrinium moseri TaxID=1658444 RepID=UPI001FDBCF67|nr:uncharacterized protein JN550_003825 [Neoarthrinium moseri]KAI1872951.1 hypothetical protein JN550_003825 [Neoarthrinium moseri]
MLLPTEGWQAVILPTHLFGALVVVISLPILWVAIDYARVLRLRRKLPPGPLPLPLFGSYFEIPRYKPWVHWEQLSKKYDNPMITVWNGNRPVIICNDAWTISDLLEKRAAIYSSRPKLYASGEMVNATESNQICLTYGDKWRLHRRLTHNVVGSQAVRGYRSIQGSEAKVLTNDLLENPAKYVSSIERYSVSVVSIIGHGRRISAIEDPVAQIALAIMEGVDYIIPCYTLVEAIPWTMKLPKWIYALPALAREGSGLGAQYFANLAKEAVNRDDNLSKRLIADQEELGITDKEIGSITGNLIGGGVDTTSSSIISFILAMCVFPEAQRRAQDEIDRVIGRDRSPSMDDEAKLSYISACASETLRWRTVTILGGIPHAPTQDDKYRGYHIPAGTAITGNVWAIHRHPRDFPAPDTFRPERFLNGLERPYPTKQGHNAFGWGRRACSGQPLAEKSLLHVITRLLWAFDIRPGLDEQGNEVTLDIFAYTSCENMRPEPFKARFIPRSEKIAEILRAEAQAAREELRTWDGDSKVTM